MYLQLESVESVGISWSQKGQASKRHNKTREREIGQQKLNHQKKIIEQVWSNEHDK
jgi:hypothetical protein